MYMDKMSEAAKIGIKFMSEQVIKLSDNAVERIIKKLRLRLRTLHRVRIGVKSVDAECLILWNMLK